MPADSEVATPPQTALENEIANQSSSSNTSNPDTEENKINQQTTTGKQRTKAAQTMRELKQRAQKQQKYIQIKKEKAFLKQLDVILSETEEEDEVQNNDLSPGTPQREESPKEDDSPQAPQPPSRRGERPRNKPDFYGHKIMVTQLSPKQRTRDKTIPKTIKVNKLIN